MRRALALTVTVALSLVLTSSAQRPAPSPPTKRDFETLADTLSMAARRGSSPPRLAFEGLRRVVPMGTDTGLPVTIRVRPGRAAALDVLGVSPLNVRADVLEAIVTPAQLLALARTADVVSVDPIVADQPRVVSEGLAVHNVHAVHAQGLTGAGVRVGVIDSFLGFSALQGTELPTHVTARCYAGIGQPTSSLPLCMTGSSHGTAVAETLMDVAPAAELFIANPTSRLDFMDTMNWMAAAGVKVINYSAARPWDGPGDGSSPFADSPLLAVHQAVGGGAVFVAAAGNEATATWFGAFTDADGNGFQDFGSQNTNSVFLVSGWTYALQLRWEDSWTAATRDLDVGLYDASFNLVAASTAPQSGGLGHVPFEFVIYTPPASGLYHIGLYRQSGSAPAWLQLQSFTGEDLAINSGGPFSIGSPAESASPGAVAVGASPWTSPSQLEPFSSQGPTPDGRVKPDVVGVDRASTVTYGAGGFAGTSQASPHVTGIVALIRQQFPSHTPAEAVALLKSTARSRGAIPNNQWGYGLAFGCSYALSTTALTSGALAGVFPVSVTTESGCPWQAMSQASWLTALPSSGTGPGVVNLTLQANPAVDPRASAVTIAGLPVSVTQSGLTDSDADGLSDEWETSLGLDPSSSTGANGGSGDPDGDGRSNLQEQADRTHPRGFFARYLAEGAQTAFFDTRLAVLNPGAQTSRVLARFVTSTGTVVPRVLHVAGETRLDLDGADLAALNLNGTEFSVSVESDSRVVVDRTMRWRAGGAPYGSHSETSLASPAPTWYLAEGATHSGFQLFYLIQNPSPSATASMQVRYLLPSGAPVVKTYSVGPSSRFTIWANTIPELASTDVSAVVSSTNGVPVIVERAMYSSGGGVMFQGGHGSAGVTAPSLTWLFAEGATGPYFDEYLLVANPDTRSAAIEVRFLLSTGQVVTKRYTVPAASRFNLWVDRADPQLADAAISAAITVTNGVPVVAERSMWWPGPTAATWVEAHASVGATAPATKWAMAEGEVGGPENAETYVLIANTSMFSANVSVKVFGVGGLIGQKTYAIAPSTRFNVPMRTQFPALDGVRFGVLVESLGATPAQLVVERAHYGDAGGVHWASGSSALATPWPP